VRVLANHDLDSASETIGFVPVPLVAADLALQRVHASIVRIAGRFYDVAVQTI
jgi:hypothetical protein